MPSKPLTPQAVEEKVKQIVMQILCVNVEQLTPEATLDDLGADSLDEINIVMAAEDAFDVEIPDEEAAARQTLPAITEYIIRLKGLK